MEGWLELEQSFGWKKFWFSLRGSELAWFEEGATEQDSLPHGNIVFDANCSVGAPKSSRKGRHALRISLPDHHKSKISKLILSADSEKDASEWIRALSEAIVNSKQQQQQRQTFIPPSSIDNNNNNKAQFHNTVAVPYSSISTSDFSIGNAPSSASSPPIAIPSTQYEEDSLVSYEIQRRNKEGSPEITGGAVGGIGGGGDQGEMFRMSSNYTIHAFLIHQVGFSDDDATTKIAEAFMENGYSTVAELEELPPTDAQLKEIGMTKMRDRNMFLRAMNPSSGGGGGAAAGAAAAGIASSFRTDRSGSVLQQQQQPGFDGSSASYREFFSGPMSMGVGMLGTSAAMPHHLVVDSNGMLLHLATPLQQQQQQMMMTRDNTGYLHPDAPPGARASVRIQEPLPISPTASAAARTSVLVETSSSVASSLPPASPYRSPTKPVSSPSSSSSSSTALLTPNRRTAAQSVILSAEDESNNNNSNNNTNLRKPRPASVHLGGRISTEGYTSPTSSNNNRHNSNSSSTGRTSQFSECDEHSISTPRSPATSSTAIAPVDSMRYTTTGVPTNNNNNNNNSSGTLRKQETVHEEEDDLVRPAPRLGQARLSGSLLKQGRDSKSWKSRFFEIRAGKIMWHKDDGKGGLPVGMIPLEKVTLSATKSIRIGKFSFRLSFDSAIDLKGRHKLVLAAASSEDRERWELALRGEMRWLAHLKQSLVTEKERKVVSVGTQLSAFHICFSTRDDQQQRIRRWVHLAPAAAISTADGQIETHSSRVMFFKDRERECLVGGFPLARVKRVSHSRDVPNAVRIEFEPGCNGWEGCCQSCDEVANTALSQCFGLPLMDLKWRLKSYSRCFYASDLVNWILDEGLAHTRDEAVKFGKGLVRAFVIHHVGLDQDFEDSKLPFRFCWNDIVFTGAEPLILQADTYDEANQWVQQLRRMVGGGGYSTTTSTTIDGLIHIFEGEWRQRWCSLEEGYLRFRLGSASGALVESVPLSLISRVVRSGLEPRLIRCCMRRSRLDRWQGAGIVLVNKIMKLASSTSNNNNSSTSASASTNSGGRKAIRRVASFDNNNNDPENSSASATSLAAIAALQAVLRREEESFSAGDFIQFCIANGLAENEQIAETIGIRLMEVGAMWHSRRCLPFSCNAKDERFCLYWNCPEQPDLIVQIETESEAVDWERALGVDVSSSSSLVSTANNNNSSGNRITSAAGGGGGAIPYGFSSFDDDSSGGGNNAGNRKFDVIHATMTAFLLSSYGQLTFEKFFYIQGLCLFMDKSEDDRTCCGGIMLSRVKHIHRSYFSPRVIHLSFGTLKRPNRIVMAAAAAEVAATAAAAANIDFSSDGDRKRLTTTTSPKTNADGDGDFTTESMNKLDAAALRSNNRRMTKTSSSSSSSSSSGVPTARECDACWLVGCRSLDVQLIERIRALAAEEGALRMKEYTMRNSANSSRVIRCFRGCHLVSLLVTRGLVDDRSAAENLGRRLLKSFVLRHVEYSSTFSDSVALYVFAWDDADIVSLRLQAKSEEEAVVWEKKLRMCSPFHGTTGELMESMTSQATQLLARRIADRVFRQTSNDSMNLCWLLQAMDTFLNEATQAMEVSRLAGPLLLSALIAFHEELYRVLLSFVRTFPTTELCERNNLWQLMGALASFTSCLHEWAECGEDGAEQLAKFQAQTKGFFELVEIGCAVATQADIIATENVNSLNRVIEVCWKESSLDGDGRAHTGFPTDAFQLISQHFAAVGKTKNPEFIFLIAQLGLLPPIGKMQQLLGEIIDKNWHEIEIDLLCAYANDCYRCSKNLALLQEEMAAVVGQSRAEELVVLDIDDGFRGLRRKCSVALAERLLLLSEVSNVAHEIYTAEKIEPKEMDVTPLQSPLMDLQRMLENKIFRETIHTFLSRVVMGYVEGIVSSRHRTIVGIGDRLFHELASIRQFFLQFTTRDAIQSRLKILDLIRQILTCELEQVDSFWTDLCACSDATIALVERLLQLRPDVAAAHRPVIIRNCVARAARGTLLDPPFFANIQALNGTAPATKQLVSIAAWGKVVAEASQIEVEQAWKQGVVDTTAVGGKGRVFMCVVS